MRFILIIFVLIGLTASGQRRNLFHAENTPKLLLDNYRNASLAFSMRKINSQYNGNCIRVRRSSDNTESDIGFDAMGNLDQSALTTFCGAGNGFVTKWYDQSGNAADAAQATQANQPQIVTSGTINTDNSRPTIAFNGTSQFLNITANLSNTSTTLSAFMAIHKTAAGGARRPLSFVQSGTTGGDFGSNNHINYNVSASVGDTSFNSYRQTAGTVSIPDNTISFMRLFTVVNDGLGRNNWLNGGSRAFVSETANFNYSYGRIGAGINSGAGQPAFSYFNGNISEVICYHSNQYDTRATIEANINSYYSIY